MPPLSRRPYFARTPSRDVRRARYPSGEPLLEFEECVEIFTRRRHVGQQLTVDVKDFGFEAAHLAIVERYGIADHVSWISWIPESLRRLRTMGARGPLILAHCNLTRLASLGRLIEHVCARRAFQLAHVVLLGSACEDAIPASFAHGFQHGLLISRLPADLEHLLADSGGGICVNRLLVNPHLLRYCSGAGLALWVFRVRTVADYQRYASLDDVNRVFCDNAPAVLEAAREAAGFDVEASGLATAGLSA